MLSLSSLIEFLLDMLRDEATQADFERDPSGTLAARGLSEVTAQDVRDVQPILADVGGVHRVVDHGPAHHGHAAALHGPAAGGGHGGAHGFSGAHGSAGAHGGGGHGGGGHDVVREIHHVTHEYTVARPVTHVTQEFKSYNEFTEFTDNSIHASDGSTVISGSYNQDNDGVDNKGGTIDGSTVGGGAVENSGNTTATTTVEGSHNTSVEVEDSGNESVDQDWTDVGNDGGSHGGSSHDGGEDDDGDSSHVSIAYDEPHGGSADVNDSYSAQSSASSVEVSDGSEHAAAAHL